MYRNGNKKFKLCIIFDIITISQLYTYYFD